MSRGLRGPDREARLQAPGGRAGRAGRPGPPTRQQRARRPFPEGAGRRGAGWAEGHPGRGLGASWVFAQAWRPLRPHLSTLVIVSGHWCPSLRLGASGRAVGSPGQGRRLHRGDARLPPRAWLERSAGLLALPRPPTAPLGCRGWGGAAPSQAGGTISGRRFPRGLTSARRSRKEGPLPRR